MATPTGYPVGRNEPFDPFPALRRAAADESEYSWGGGLTPSWLEDAPPIAGGRYRGCAPEPDRIFSVSRDRRG